MKKTGLLTLVCLALLIALPMAMQSDEGAKYLGSKKCKVCHSKADRGQYKSWAESVHAKAHESLKEGNKLDGKDHTADAECLVCHSTGYGKEGGFVSEAETPNLAGVGCESCHGAAGNYLKMHMTGKYTKDEFKAAGGIPPTEEVCVTCHNKKSPTYKEFKFDKTENVHESFPLKKPH